MSLVADNRMKYGIYGCVLESFFPLENTLVRAPKDATPDVRFVVSDRSLTPPETARRIWGSFDTLEDGRPVFEVYRDDDAYILSFSDLVRYRVCADRIEAELISEEHGYLIEIHLLGLLLSFWLEQRGTLALHAAAVVVHGQGVGFLATNKGGKTSLAATFLRHGNPLLTDDILAVRATPDGPTAAPGYPQMRMWPDQAHHFSDEVDALPLVHPLYDKRRIDPSMIGKPGFHASPVPILAILIPARTDADADTRLEPLSESEAFRLLLTNGFIPGIAEAAGLRRRRFENLTAIVRELSVFQLTYPTGYEHLPAVREAILEGLHFA